jgi:superfamily II DNA or RNA helicase
MPRIFDNIDQKLLPALGETLGVAYRADFCVGYFNLRGWRLLDGHLDHWESDGERCRLLIGMQSLPQDELWEALSLVDAALEVDNPTAVRLRRKVAAEFRAQLSMGLPTAQDEVGLRRLADRLRSGRLCVKLALRKRLHAKLYLLFRHDPVNPVVGFLGSSNLTFAGLQSQGELNVDVLDHDACAKLAKWFDDRWDDRMSLEISDELVALIDESWARVTPLPPHHVYVKMAYHLAREARAGLSEFRIPREFSSRLFEFQTAAVKIAAHHLNKRGGVLIGDVVGLGKTLMATALAKIFEETHFIETLIICPANLVPMWEDHRHRYRLHAKVLSLGQVSSELADLARYRLVLIDESHNLRNREGKRYRAIAEYIQRNDSKVILLSATPYNKTYLDLSSQLRLFIDENEDIGVRPERLLRELGETEFVRRHQCPPRSLAAFEKSPYVDDWRELMRLYLVRRTRSFIKQHYADLDAATGRRYLTLEDGTRSFFPDRVPRTVRFSLDDTDPSDPYARLYSAKIIGSINALTLPRYGLGNYVAAVPPQPPSPADAKILQGLSRAGQRLTGFCRTNLFKRLESSGASFLLSVQRHVLRNHVFLHAIDSGLPLPLGTQGAELLDARVQDEDADDTVGDSFEDTPPVATATTGLRTAAEFRARAAQIYAEYQGALSTRFRWLSSGLFREDLAKHLRRDADALVAILDDAGEWAPEHDAKLNALFDLLSKQHPREKVLVFSQFADTARYLDQHLRARGLAATAAVTGNSGDPTDLAWRFSPQSNERTSAVPKDRELRVLVATDVLSEGQNLQDAAIVVNYDLPWAIIRLVQRAGRVDRIGQHAHTILCYSFLPAAGVERVIRLRSRVTQRLVENAEVVGTDESFFEDTDDEQMILDLYNEKSGILDGEGDAEVDLASYAYQVWKEAIDRDPALAKSIPGLPDVVYATRAHQPTERRPDGVLVFLRTGEDNDALAYLDPSGKSITESQLEILKAAECPPDTPATAPRPDQHALVAAGVEHVLREEQRTGGQLGRPGSARFRTYERLKRHAETLKGTLFDLPELHRAVDEIYRFPLRSSAVDVLNRELKLGIDDERLRDLVLGLRDDGRLCVVEEQSATREPRILCSMGLSPKGSS